jgi:hypothetical protein
MEMRPAISSVSSWRDWFAREAMPHRIHAHPLVAGPEDLPDRTLLALPEVLGGTGPGAPSFAIGACTATNWRGGTRRCLLLQADLISGRFGSPRHCTITPLFTDVVELNPPSP